jgi:hypothetical protein
MTYFLLATNFGTGMAQYGELALLKDLWVLQAQLVHQLQDQLAHKVFKV